MSLAVTAGDLRAGQGYVRCGRCSNVFNALLTLSEEPASEPPAPAAGTPPAAAGPVPAPVVAPAEPAAPEPAPAPAPAPAAAVSELSPPPAFEMPDAQTLEEEGVSTGTFETIVLEGDAILQTEEVVPQEEIDHELLLFREQVEPVAMPALSANATEPLPPELALLPEPAPPRPARRWLYGSLGVLALLALAAQAVHHWRNELATLPGWYAPMSTLYAKLGLPLNPAWDLAAYDLRQQGASGDGNAIHVRISVANRGRRAQPMPIVRLTLLDRYGKRVGTRDLQPADYLDATQLALGFLRADQRIDSNVAVQDPGPDAASFELDACLAGSGRSIRCAADAAGAR